MPTEADIAPSPRRAPGRQRPRPRSRTAPLWVAAGLAAALLAWLAVSSSQDRFWDDTRAAGHRAYKRGNFLYAQRMYREALQQARDLDPDGRRVIQSLLDMSRVCQARGRSDSASMFRARAEAVGKTPHN